MSIRRSIFVISDAARTQRPGLLDRTKVRRHANVRRVAGLDAMDNHKSPKDGLSVGLLRPALK